MHDGELRRADLYRPPWSAVDNVNGWIEPTLRCNLKCTACYRLGQNETFPFEEMKEFVDKTIEFRNCDHVSIAGEPLLVDYLDDLVRYIRSRGCRTTVLTNGVLLDDARLASLREAGLDRINLHVDSGQNRPGWEDRNERELLELKQDLVDRIHAHGLQCGLISVLYERTFAFLPDILEWTLANSAKISNITLDLFRHYPDPQYLKRCFSGTGEEIEPARLGRIATVADERRSTIRDVYRAVRKVIADFTPHSYLNGTDKQGDMKWLLTTMILLDGEILGYLGPRAAEFATASQHFLTGRYPSFIGSRPSKSMFLTSLFDAKVRGALKNYAARCLRNPANLARRIRTLSVCIVQPSDWYTDGVQNMCDSCPDAILWNDMLVPSCRLDEFKQFGSYVRMEFEDGIPRNHDDLNATLESRSESKDPGADQT